VHLRSITRKVRLADGVGRRGLRRGAATVALIAAAVHASVATPAAQARQAGTPPDTGRAVALDTLQITVVRGLRPLADVPAAVAVVGEPAIRLAQPSLSLEESLRRIPGVVVDHRHNYSVGDRISIRGFGTRAAFGVRGVRVLADGIPLTTPDGQTNLNNIDLASAGRIEVIRGPASSLYGNAAGGVISVVTQQPPPVPFAFEARGVLGDYGGTALGNLSRGEAKLGGRRGSWSYLVSGSHTDADGYREHSRVRQTLLNSNVRVALDARSALTPVVNVADVPVAQNPGALPLDSVLVRPRGAWPRNVETGAGSDTRQAQIGAVYARAVGGGRFDVAAHAVRRDLTNPLPFGVIGLRRHAGGVRGALATATRAGELPIALTTGFDVEIMSDDRTEHDNAGGRRGDQLRRDQTDQVASVGPFAELTFGLGPADVTAGARYDVVRFRTTDRFLDDGRDDSGERTLSAVSPMVGMRWAAGATTTLFANAATSFQTPTTTELINAPPPAGEPCCPGGFNARLEPQRARSVEVGVRTQPHAALQFEASAYAMRIRGALVPFQVAGIEGREFFRNAGRSRHRGVELLAVWQPVPAAELHAAYTFSDFRYVDAALPGGSFEGNRYPGVAPHRLMAGTVLRVIEAARIAVDAVHTSEFYVTDANDAVNAAATVVHARVEAARAFGAAGVRPFLGVSNVANARYNAAVVLNAAGGRYFEPAPARSIHLGVAVALGEWRR
jgi:iron complex outermembrane recepter protein